MRSVFPALVLCASISAPAVAAPVPEGVRQMVEAAVAGGDPAVLAAVLSVARKVAPASASDIDALAGGPLLTPPVKQLAAVPAENPPPPPPAWKGSVELGGSQATGSANVASLYGAADLAWVGPAWTHKVTSRADYQETDGQAETQRLSFAYQAQRRYGSSFYTYGLGQFEHDRSVGVRGRYTLGAGAGVQALDAAGVTIAVEAGPAVRRTETYGRDLDEALAGRASLQLRWSPTRRLAFSQDTAVYFEREQANTRSVTSVETQLFGPLKGRLSYNVQHEFDRRIGRSALDTTTRASLRYNF